MVLDRLGRSEEPVVGVKVKASDLPACNGLTAAVRGTRLQLSRFWQSTESGHDVHA